MGRTENQKLKLLYLKELFERQSDEEHLLSMQDILDALAAQGIPGRAKERIRRYFVPTEVRHGYRDGQGPERRVFSCLAHV